MYQPTLLRNGFRVNISKISKELLNKLKKDLMITPHQYQTYTTVKEDDDGSFPIYKETGKYILIPKFYGKNLFTEYKTDIEKGEKCKDMKFKGQLRDYQEPIVDKVLTQIKKEGGGLLSIGCGKGKTCMAINMACQLKKKTLVIVHAEFLVNQWKEQIKLFTDCSVGTIQKDKVDIDGHQFVVGMLQSICKEKYDSIIFDQFGFLVFDEAHHCSSRYFSKALPLVTTYKTLALSATPKRQDRCEKVLYWCLGNVAYEQKTDFKSKITKNNTALVKVYHYNSTDKDYKDSINGYTGKPDTARNINRLVKIRNRNRFIYSLIMDYVDDPDRYILILSDRKEDHLYILGDMFDKADFKDYGYYVGGMKQAKLDESAKKKVILSTYQMTSEGFDVPRLNTVIMATPRSNVKQSIGRVQRKQEFDTQPHIIDIFDQLPTFKSGYYSRSRTYKEAKYYMQHFDVSDREITKEGDIIEPKQPVDLKKTKYSVKLDEPDKDPDFSD